MKVDPKHQAWGWGCSKCGRATKDDKRTERNCDRTKKSGLPIMSQNRRMSFCPWSASPAAFRVISWWEDFKTFKTLPYAWGKDLKDEPAFVYEAIRFCENTANEATSRIQAVADADNRNAGSKGRR